MPNQDKEISASLDVQQIYPPQAALGQGALPAQSAPNSNGYVVVPGGAQSPIVVLNPTPAAQPAATQPSVVVLTVAAKEAKKEEKKEVSGVFQRL